MLKKIIKEEVGNYARENRESKSFRFFSIPNREVIFDGGDAYSDSTYLKEDDQFGLTWDVTVDGQQIIIENFNFTGNYNVISYDNDEILDTVDPNEGDWEFEFEINTFDFSPNDELYVSTVLFSFTDGKCYVYFN